MNIRELNAALAHIEAHPDDVNTPALVLAERYPDIAFSTWIKAKAFTIADSAKNPLHKPPQAGDTTIIHIHVDTHTVDVMYNGVSRKFKLKANEPLELAKMYRLRGYKQTWLTGEVILLTKKIHGNVKERIAA